jgi:hypothetical protein
LSRGESFQSDTNASRSPSRAAKSINQISELKGSFHGLVSTSKIRTE